MTCVVGWNLCGCVWDRETPNQWVDWSIESIGFLPGSLWEVSLF